MHASLHAEWPSLTHGAATSPAAAEGLDSGVGVPSTAPRSDSSVTLEGPASFCSESRSEGPGEAEQRPVTGQKRLAPEERIQLQRQRIAEVLAGPRPFEVTPNMRRRLPEVPRLRNKYHDQCIIMNGSWSREAATVKRHRYQVAESLGLEEFDWDTTRVYEIDVADLQLAAEMKAERHLHHCAQVIQRNWMEWKQSRQVIKFLEQQHQSAARVQRWLKRRCKYRIGFEAHCAFSRKRKRAALVIQAHLRAWLVRKTLRMDRELHGVVYRMRALQHQLLHFTVEDVTRLQQGVRFLLSLKRSKKRAGAELADESYREQQSEAECPRSRQEALSDADLEVPELLSSSSLSTKNVLGAAASSKKKKRGSLLAQDVHRRSQQLQNFAPMLQSSRCVTAGATERPAPVRQLSNNPAATLGSDHAWPRDESADRPRSSHRPSMLMDEGRAYALVLGSIAEMPGQRSASTATSQSRASRRISLSAFHEHMQQVHDLESREASPMLSPAQLKDLTDRLAPHQLIEERGVVGRTERRQMPVALRHAYRLFDRITTFTPLSAR